MKVNTKYHGIRDYSENDVITFKRGLPGFENLNKFIIFPVEENELFSILHSIEDEDTGLIVISPFSKFKDYEFKLSDEKLKELEITDAEDVLVVNTVTLSTDSLNITTNLKAPIIINIKKRLGEQIILDNDAYKIKQPLFENGL